MRMNKMLMSIDMELTSRLVLSDLSTALEMLEVEEDMQKFRVMWIASVSLCRSVGQVLDKVDAKRSPTLGALIKRQWQEIKSKKSENVIFHEFIEKERNLILKEYEVGFISGKFLVTDNMSFIEELDEGLYSPIEEGFYAGEDCRDVLREAISWWDEKLSELESHAH